MNTNRRQLIIELSTARHTLRTACLSNTEWRTLNARVAELSARLAK